MNFISFIMPKLAWIIPLIILFLCFYVFMQNRLSSQEDKRISEHGDNIQATIVDISYDKDQRINNNFSAVIKVHYSYGGENIFSTRGVVFPASMQDKIKIGNKIGIRVNKNKPQSFYYLDYRNV